MLLALIFGDETYLLARQVGLFFMQRRVLFFRQSSHRNDRKERFQ